MTQLPLRSQFKFATVVLLTTVAVLMIALYFHVRASLLDEREERLHEQVEIAAGILDYYHAEEAAGRLDRASAQKQAATALSAMHHEDAYFFGYDRDGIYVVQGANKDLIGKPIKGLRDASGLDLYAALRPRASTTPASSNTSGSARGSRPRNRSSATSSVSHPGAGCSAAASTLPISTPRSPASAG